MISLDEMRYELKEEEIETRIYDAKIEGIKEGREEGERIGIEKAEARAYQEKIESAKRFLEMGFSIEQVAQGTGLSVEEIKELK